MILVLKVQYKQDLGLLVCEQCIGSGSISVKDCSLEFKILVTNFASLGFHALKKLDFSLQWKFFFPIKFSLQELLGKTYWTCESMSNM